MVMKVGQPIGRAAAQGQELDRNQEKIVDSPRQSQAPVYEVVRNRSISYKAESDETEHGRGPESLCGQSEVSQKPCEGLLIALSTMLTSHATACQDFRTRLAFNACFQASR